LTGSRAVLDAKQTLCKTCFAKLDSKTGEVTYRQDILDQKIGEWIRLMSWPEGGHDWQAVSYNQPTDC